MSRPEPEPPRSLANPDVAQIKDIIQDLFRVMVVTSHYDTSGRPSKEVLTNSLFVSSVLHPLFSSAPYPKPNIKLTIILSKTLSTSLQTINKTATDPTLTLPQVPPELVKYVEGGRNPDIYTREFVELVRRGNQLVRGKMGAFETFRDVLAGEMSSAMPELKADVDRVLEATGRGAASAGADGAGPGTGSGQEAGNEAGAGTGTG